ncbi:MAG: GTPase RsgA, partial [Parvimonas micra]|nr:GTPase RsgA [Parvimonas micra]
MFEIGVIFDISKDLYYVKTKTGRYMSKARGIFRKQKFSPMVGDNVKIEIFEDNTACIVEVFERKNEILRPPVVNVDQAIIVFSLKDPEISYKIIDRYIMYYEVMKIPIILCLNKCDLIDKETEIDFRNTYEKLGYKIIFNSINLDNRKLFEE